ncbi:regulator of chromosome condensation 1/beta-lactamase-inhibitor protein II [Microdochium trichocladiopsis]|uniref:Regulator of chromosome condensation 1/beta-lactamase-inhibitor protein II n=1 Tax=Microdochium trichocladiopsis TaxID=1682393 RepID=A0A9P9BVC4_9PEZI|nr:regulator of chromosome condensation 1/beta-lactamase-inhibitor protein II [Microdochium trichocladiopsis]KAH7040108.1 regulator of chromosome condensation 1/beta-lactamase-inhibitor protein II [Microdochium trichocladiopsis]
MNDRTTMQVFAAGFNAWGQLDFSSAPSSPESLATDPQDLSTFTSILKTSTITDLQPLLASTHGENSTVLDITATFVVLAAALLTHRNSGLVLTSDGVQSAGFPSPFSKDGPLTRQLLTHQLAIAGNEKVAVISAPDTVLQYPTLAALEAGSPPEQVFTIPKTSAAAGSTSLSKPSILKVVAYQTGFALLSAGAIDSNSRVYTWGDERYSACLGRQVTGSTPADQPGLVEDLVDLPTGPIRKIAAGGYILLAVTEGNDLYAWGGHPGWSTLIHEISETPMAVDIDGQDIVDCGVGDQHAIALTSNGRLYVTGDNTNGQLGIPRAKKIQSWEEVSLSLREHGTITGVRAGGRTSFILVKSSTP